MSFIFITGPRARTLIGTTSSQDRKIGDPRSIRRFFSAEIYRASVRVPRHNPTWIPRPSAADPSTSHFSRGRTKGTPSGGWDGARSQNYLLGLSVRTAVAAVDVPQEFLVPDKGRHHDLPREFGCLLKGPRSKELPLIVANDSTWR